MSIKKSRTPFAHHNIEFVICFHPKQINSNTTKSKKQSSSKTTTKAKHLQTRLLPPSNSHDSSHLSPSRSFLPRNDWPHNVPRPTRTAHWQQHGPITSRSRGPVCHGKFDRHVDSELEIVAFFQSIPVSHPVDPNLSPSVPCLPVWQLKNHSKPIELSNKQINPNKLKCLVEVNWF